MFPYDARQTSLGVCVCVLVMCAHTCMGAYACMCVLVWKPEASFDRLSSFITFHLDFWGRLSH